MSIQGSSIINTSSKGLPDFSTDRPFSFALGTQIFLNPSAEPTDGILSFKIDTSLINSRLSAGSSSVAMGLATDAELDSISKWTSTKISGDSGNLFSVGFSHDSTVTNKLNINILGQGLTRYVSKPIVVDSVIPSSNSIRLPSNLFSTGDRVRVSSSGDLPDGITADESYFVIREDARDIMLARSRGAALAGQSIAITNGGSGTITVESDEIYTLKRSGQSGKVTLAISDVVVATFPTPNSQDPLRSFYWCKEKSFSDSLPLIKEIKVQGAI